MGINIQPKNDISYLFSGLNQSISVGNGNGSNWLSDYASIKNGSYGKLMKAYYGKDTKGSLKNFAQDKVNSLEKDSEEAKTIAKLQNASDALKENADALLDKKTFEAKETEDVYKAVNSFVDSYNRVLSALDQTKDSSILRRGESLAKLTLSNMKSLKEIGITFNENGTLSLNKDDFMKADISKVKNVFQTTGSYGYQASAQASLIHFAADHASAGRGFYDMNGSYSNAFNSGNLFNSYF